MYTSKYSRGWKPSLPDQRDLRYSAPRSMLGDLPKSIDLRSEFPTTWDQGSLGSCVSQTVAAMLYHLETKCRDVIFTPSRLLIYYNARMLEDSIDYDSGVSMRNGIKAVAKWGFCDEMLWPYEIDKFKKKPNKKIFAHSSENKILQYEKLNQDLISMKSCLAEGNSFAFGFSVYESFESQEVAQTGNMKIPAANEAVFGGHAVLACGFNDEIEKFIIRNSWGQWGDKGYFTMPYSFITNNTYCDDFWTIKAIN